MDPKQNVTSAFVNELKSGNKRFIENDLSEKDHTAIRNRLALGQQPHSVILSCADSRVVPEYIFDQPPGVLFVIRNGGNILTNEVSGSIEFAVSELGCKFILVLGHEKCGAVMASIGGKTQSPYINSIVERIQPAINNTIKSHEKEVDITQVVIANVKHQLEKVLENKALQEKVDSGELGIAGAYYSLETGEVIFL